jgi:APA family basic amino acid/polyamine antiporter
VQLIFTSAKLIALFAIIILGLIIALGTDVFSHNLHQMWNATKTTLDTNGNITIEQLTGWTLIGALGATIINPLFSSDAWNNVTFIAGEIKDPQKNIPRSLFVGTLVVTIIYILANVAYLALLPLQGDPNATDVVTNGIQFASNDRVGAAAAYMIFGQSATYIMAALIMVSTFGCNNGLILSGARLYYAMSNDGLFFKKAGQLNSKEVPGFALILQCVWASALCLSGKYGDLLEYATFASLIFYIVTIAGIFILRKKEPTIERPYKARGYPFVPILYIIITSLICIDLLIYKPYSAGLGLLIVLLGLPIYFIKKKIKLT